MKKHIYKMVIINIHHLIITFSCLSWDINFCYGNILLSLNTHSIAHRNIHHMLDLSILGLINQVARLIKYRSQSIDHS